ncbi:hypothetical protein EW146_g7660 [Bondarzewia mesenterica]|uniref:Uncharacterized protein n=1 Tax=Bondarzewia mesenterica TaxID=1095465 RepID=A0A4S4LKC0_9AGAM|nr:hypothetical protein EW146_g7660 [Bondarzewia mesenterica]
MVHRPTDSRLLSNLLQHEKDYSKHLLSLLDSVSQESLSSFSAYASASPPVVARAIIAVAGSLAGADDALRKYALSVDAWREQLARLKDLEDDIGTIMRDREILVTRLIKVSKHQKSTRDSFIANIGPSPSSMSQSSLTSSIVSTNASSKLSAAQAELQACETQLAAKERELDAMRVSAVRQGLYLRCTAMVECGWTWGEMGKEGLRALEGMTMPNGHAMIPDSHGMHKPLPDPTHYHAGSDLSSLGPSQSASQIALPLENGFAERGSSHVASPVSNQVHSGLDDFTLHIDPPHSISEFVFPQRVGIERRITEEEEPVLESSSEDEDKARSLRVVENTRFTQPGSSSSPRPSNPRGFSVRTHQRQESGSSLSERPHAHHGLGRFGASLRGRGRRVFFGSIAGLFKGGHRAESGRWKTRTDKNLKKARAADSDSGDEAPQSVISFRRRASVDDVNHRVPGGPDRQKLRKKPMRGTSVPADSSTKEAGWVSEGGAFSSSITRKGKGKAETPSSVPEKPAILPAPKAKVGQTQPKNVLLAPLSPSRQNSISKTSVLSVASAPPSVPRATSATPAPPRGRGGGISTSQSTGAVKRSASMAHKRVSAPPGGGKASTWTGPHPHPQARSVGGQQNQPSLMSIVEGVTRENREGWAAATTATAGVSGSDGGGLISVKAPPPLKEYNLWGEGGKGISFESVVAPLPVTAPLRGTADRGRGREEQRPLEVIKPKPIPAKSPLRSALKSPSRTPSPMALHAQPPAPAGPSLQTRRPQASRAVKSSEQGEVRRGDNDDASSISSYETGHEAFDEEEERQSTPRPPPPPAPPEKLALGPARSDISSSTITVVHGDGNVNGSAQGRRVGPSAPPVRRKSVRMSLQPTYSPTPPALDDEDERRPRVEKGGEQHERHQRDMWADSSDEDEEYARAKVSLRKAANKKW